MTLQIVCVDSNDYEGRGCEYVTKLYDMVTRNLPEGFPGKFVCFSDYCDDYGHGIEVRKLPGYLVGWFNKLYLFKGTLFPRGDRIVYFDLDTVITGKLDDIVQYDGPLALLRDFYRPNGCQSSVMLWESGEKTDIWSLFVEESFPDVPGGDQAWIEMFEPAILDDAFPRAFVSYKAHRCINGPPKDAAVVVFHGHPRPHECGGWLDHVWKIGGGTSAMLESVCNTAESDIVSNARTALQRGWRELSYREAHDGVLAIVGGSPSLPEYIGYLPARCDVIGLNAAATWLIDHGIRCHQAILDARPEMAAMVERRAGQFFIASQCHPSVFDRVPMISATVFHPNAPGIAELAEKGSPLIGGGTTVGLQALVVGYVLGYRKFHLFGMDSSYRNNEGHAYAQPLNDGDSRLDVIVAGRQFSAAPWMAQQAEEFQNVAASLANMGCEIVVHGEGLLPAIAREMGRQTALAERGIIEPDGSPACQRASEVARRIGDFPGLTGAEVGVFRGHMSRRLLAYMPNLHLVMVDSWDVSDPKGDYASTSDFHAGLSAEEQERFAGEAKGNIAFADDRAAILREPSISAAAKCLDGSLDFVFIDADHSYSGCKADIAAWFPKVKPGGLICGHDYNNTTCNFGVNRAVDEFIAESGLTLELGENFTWFARLAPPLQRAA